MYVQKVKKKELLSKCDLKAVEMSTKHACMERMEMVAPWGGHRSLEKGVQDTVR